MSAWNWMGVVSLWIGLVAGGAGCATLARSVALGAGVGAGLGATVGVAANSQSAAGIATGALVGAAVGGVAAYFIHAESRKADPLMNPNGFRSEDEKVPPLKNAETRRIWVPAKIEGKRYVHGHYVDIIEHDSAWESSDEQ